VLMWDSVLGECEFGWHCSVTALQRAWTGVDSVDVGQCVRGM